MGCPPGGYIRRQVPWPAAKTKKTRWSTPPVVISAKLYILVCIFFERVYKYIWKKHSVICQKTFKSNSKTIIFTTNDADLRFKKSKHPIIINQRKEKEKKNWWNIKIYFRNPIPILLLRTELNCLLIKLI